MEWLLTQANEQLLIHASDSAPYHSRMGKSKKEGEDGMRQVASGVSSVLEKCRILREVEGVLPGVREVS